jgi:putrescine importer
MNDAVPATGSAAPQLRRALSVWNITLYGIVVVTPAGAMFNFGVISAVGHGHFPVSIVLALFPMLLTAVSYGRLASVYPSAGSAFAYVSQEIGAAPGYAVGWSLVMDYLLIPLAAILWCSQQAHDMLPGVPLLVWELGFTGLLTYLNLQAVTVSARLHGLIAAVILAVVLVFIAAAVIYVGGHDHAGPAFYTRPFYDPRTWDRTAIIGGASIAVLTYMGFDGISTLAEEVENPKTAIFTAMMLACLFTGGLSVIEGYLAQLVWPAYQPYPNIDTAFTFVAQRAWPPLYAIVGITLIVASLGSGLAMQMAAARLLYGMGRGGVLPPRIFAAIDAENNVPRNNVLIIGLFVVAGTIVFPCLATRFGDASAFELSANLLNFGALTGFMGVHVVAFRRFFLLASRRTIANALIPGVGFVTCALLWWNLSRSSHLLGAIWLLAGGGVALSRRLGGWRLPEEAPNGD